MVVVSLLATVAFATPAAAIGGGASEDCANVVLRETQSEDAYVDVYVTQLGSYESGPHTLDLATAKQWVSDVTGQLDEGRLGPGEVGRATFIVQVEFQVPQQESAGTDGLRATYRVNVSACTGL